MDLDPFTSLAPAERTTYAAGIDDALAKHGRDTISGDLVLKKLQEGLSCGPTTQQRHQIKLLIIQRLKQQPAPHTVMRTNDHGAGPSRVTPGTAAIAVINIPELLESILSHLPMKDLFAASRVNKAFHRLIETSPTLKRKLFLLPGESQPKYWQLVRNWITGKYRTVIAPTSEIFGTLPASEDAFGKPSLVARVNPLLKLEGRKKMDMLVKKMVLPREVVLDSAILDKRILDSKAWPHMYLTDPPCACVHIDVDYADTSLIGCTVLRARRCVYDPAGVTFGAIHDALHEKGPDAIYERRKHAQVDSEMCIEHETTIREQLQILEREGFRLSVTERLSVVEFCHLTTPSEAEFEEMGRTGRVEGIEGSRRPALVIIKPPSLTTRPLDGAIPRRY
ncbi:hypothetical protein Q7P35_009124 [Cladosporium inversicolor]